MNQTNIVNNELTSCAPVAMDFRNNALRNNYCDAKGRYAGSESILKGLRNIAQGCEELATLGDRLRISTSMPLHRAFTLIELLVVIAVMAILAALVIPVTGAVKAASTKARVRTELAQLETAIDRYKIKLGHYPPDNPGLNPGDPPALVNQLYYELMGTTNDGRFYRTLDGSTSIDINQFGPAFGPKVSGFVNSTKGGGGDEGGSAQRFLDTGVKPSQIAVAPKSGATILVGIPWQKGPPPFDTSPFGPSAPTLNPWRYNSSSPIHNPNSYDLWLDVVIGSRAFRICNWSKQPIRIADLKP